MFLSGCNAAHLASGGPPLAQLPDADLLDRLRALGGTPLETLADPDLMELYLPVVRADLAAAETYEYRPGRPLTCPITAFLGNVDSETDGTSVCGWGDLTVAPFRMHELSGDHFFINTRAPQIISAIAGQLMTTAAAPSAD